MLPEPCDDRIREAAHLIVLKGRSRDLDIVKVSRDSAAVLAHLQLGRVFGLYVFVAPGMAAMSELPERMFHWGGGVEWRFHKADPQLNSHHH
jgi:hypothetical protein